MFAFGGYGKLAVECCDPVEFSDRNADVLGNEFLDFQGQVTENTLSLLKHSHSDTL
jgi:hypothetical protein